MRDLAEIAKEMLKSKNQGKASKLSLDDVQDLIIHAIGDLAFDKSEIYAIKKINRYYPEHMSDSAAELFKQFYDGFVLGMKLPKQDYRLFDYAMKLLEIRTKAGSPKLIKEDMRSIIIFAIKDGDITDKEIEHFNAIREMYPEYMNEEAKDMFVTFYNGLVRLSKHMNK